MLPLKVASFLAKIVSQHVSALLHQKLHHLRSRGI
jgi:hypothetical protein